MGEASRVAQVPPHTLRYWEEKIGFLRPARRNSGHRRYTREDLETILFIKDLIQRKRMTLPGARRALIERRRGVKPAAPAETAANWLPASTAKLLRELKKEIQALVEELK